MSAVLLAPDPLVRPMQANDLSEVMEVELAAYEFPWTLSIFRNCLRMAYHCYVYQGPGGLIGHGIMSTTAGECHLLNICVHPEYQRRGLGTRMVNFLLDIARGEDARVALLEVRVTNTGAYRLYSRMGFDEVGVRREYYPARQGREDAIILAKEL